MARFGFVGGSYQSQSVNADAQMTMNWIPEINESGAGKAPIPMYPSPGLAIAYQLGNDPVRGEITFNGRSFAVAGTTFFELLVGGAITPFAGLMNDGQPVTMVGGGVPGALQILICCAGNGYVFDLQANTLTQVSPAMQIGPWSTVAYIDEFFIALIQNSSEFQISNITNANIWSLGDVSQVELIPDSVVSMLADHRELWLWGSRNTVVYFNSGDPLFPFSPIPGAFIEQGSAALFGAVRADNSVFWLGADERGGGVIWRAQGYSPVRVSHFALETALASYPTIADAVAYSYQENGHTFCVWNFPTADRTWAYDVSTGMWHQRGFWNGVKFTAHRARSHTFGFGLHLVGDYTTGNIYQMSSNILNDFGNSIRRVRRAPHISSEQEWIFHHQLQVDAETGLGTFATGALFLQSPNGQIWSVSVDSSGLLHSAASFGTPATVFLNDSTSASSWLIGINNAGLLTTTSVALNAAYPQALLLTNAFSSWNLGVTLGGLLQTTNVTGTGGAIVSPSGSPQFMLRWSDDGGHSWSNEYPASAGAPGQYKYRSIWRRLGRSRDRVYELSVSDNSAWRIVDAYLQATPGYIPTERISTQLRKSA